MNLIWHLAVVALFLPLGAAAPVPSAPSTMPAPSTLPAPLTTPERDPAATGRHHSPLYSAQFLRSDVIAEWQWPRGLPVEVTRRYVAPATVYSTGHRGIDLTAAPGTAVLAPAAGTVGYIGVVVDRPVIALDHDGDLRSSFEPVEASVAVGERVSAGQQIGVVGRGGHCSAECFHFGVRLHGVYVSPLMLLGGVPRAVLLSRDPP